MKDLILSLSPGPWKEYELIDTGGFEPLIEKGIQRMDKPYEQIEKSMEQVGKLEVYQMEKNTSILSTIAGIAPMFGFLGTIAGMIILFFNIQHDGFSLEHIAGGIYTKMVTSAVGLIIGLLSYVAYNYINAQINKAVNKAFEMLLKEKFKSIWLLPTEVAAEKLGCVVGSSEMILKV